MNRKWVLASGNKGKIKEFSSLFADWSINIVSQGELDIKSVPETGTTFIENAIIKARHAAKESDLPALADDSGLVVDSLNGAPGIYSSRYAGDSASDEDNVVKLLHALNMKTNRKAHFQCVLVFMRSAEDPVPIIAQGQWHGTITDKPFGSGGFGYDPIFKCNQLQRTAAELDKASKNKVSHRGQALTQLTRKMEALFV